MFLFNFNTTYASDVNLTKEDKDEYLVVFKSGKNEELIKKYGGEIIHEYLNFDILKVSLNLNSVEDLKANAEISSLEKIQAIKIDIEDSSYDRVERSDTANSEDWADKLTGVNKAREMGIEGKGVKIAVMDTGITESPYYTVVGGLDCTNIWPECQERNVQNYPTDINPHGSNIANIIANSNFGIAKNVSLYDIRVLGNTIDTDVMEEDVYLESFDWAIENQIDIISMSIVDREVEENGFNYSSALLESIYETTVVHGIKIFASAGNLDKEPDIQKTPKDNTLNEFPCKYELISCVGAIMKESKNNTIQRARFFRYDEFNKVSGFFASPTGHELDFVGPGVRVRTLDNKNQNIHLDGTSFSTPYVAAIYALYLEMYKGKSKSEIDWIFNNNASKEFLPIGYVGEEGNDREYGKGYPKMAFNLFENVNNKTVLNQIKDEYKLFDNSSSAYSYASFPNQKKLVKRFEVPVNVTGFDIAFPNLNDNYMFSVNFLDSERNIIFKKDFEYQGYQSFETIKDVSFVEIINKNGSVANISDFSVDGTYEKTISDIRKISYEFQSPLNELELYTTPYNNEFEEIDSITTASDFIGKTLIVSEVYDWNDTKKTYNWIRVSTNDLQIENKWIFIGNIDTLPLYKYEQTSLTFGQITNSENSSSQYRLFDDTDDYAILKNKGFVDYEFDETVSINSIYIEHVNETENNEVMITFYDKNNQSSTISLGDDELFMNHYNFSTEQENVKRVRIYNSHSLQSIKINEISFFGNQPIDIPPISSDIKKSAILKKGKIVVSDNPNYAFLNENYEITDDFYTYITKGIGLSFTGEYSKGFFKWVFLTLPNGEQKWVSSSTTNIVIDEFQNNGLIDTIPAEQTSFGNISYGQTSLHNNNIREIGTTFKKDGYVIYNFFENTNVSSIYLNLRDYVDIIPLGLSIELYDKYGDVLYRRNFTKQDYYKKVFDLPTTIRGVDSFKISNSSSSSIRITEFELFE